MLLQLLVADSDAAATQADVSALFGLHAHVVRQVDVPCSPGCRGSTKNLAYVYKLILKSASSPSSFEEIQLTGPSAYTDIRRTGGGENSCASAEDR